MHIPWKNHVFKVLLSLCLPLVVSGCGEGGKGGGGSKTVISGIAVKGPIKGARVGIYQLSVTGVRGSLLGSGTSGNDGSFAIPIPTSQATGPLLVTVTGQAGATYASESKGSDVPFSAAESFNAAVGTVAPNQKITVSPLTEAAFQKLPQILAAKPGPASADKLAGAITAANARIGSLFNINDILADPAGDITYRTTLLIIDQMIEDSKAPGAITGTSAVMTLLNQAFADVGQPAYQTYLQAFNTAADKVKAANPGLIAATVDAIKTRAANPPAEIDFTDTIPPSTPSNLSATTFAINATTSSVVLSWSPSTDNIAVAGYEVFRDGTKIATTTTPGYTDQPVTSNITYSYTVTAFDAAGNRSAASSPLSVKPNQATLNVTVNGQLSSGILGLPQNDIFPPTAPGTLTASTSAISATNSSVTLAWGAATDNVAVTGYEVFRDGVKIATVTAPGYTDPSVTSNVTFTYFIIAFDAAGNRSIAGNQLAVKPNQASLGVTVNGQVNPGSP